MAITAAIKITQGPHTDIPGHAVFGTLIDGAVVLTSVTSGATTGTWEVIGAPAGSAIPIGVFSTSLAGGSVAQPDVRGGYLFQLTAENGVPADTVVVQLALVVKEVSGRWIPPFKAPDTALTFAGGQRGWSPAMEEWLHHIDTLGVGDFLVRATNADRDAIDLADRHEGMVVYSQRTSSYFALGADLTTWTFIDSHPDLNLQPAWEINDATGNDANDGKTSGTALKTSEELCRRLCPGGRRYVPQQNTTIHFAAGNYGEYFLRGSWSAAISLDSLAVITTCEISSSASILLSAVVDTVPSTTAGVRGQLTTVGATDFVPNARITATSGPHAGAVTFSTGQNTSPKNHYVKEWADYNSGTLVTIAPGTTCRVDTLLVSFKRIDIEFQGPGYFEIDDAKLSGEINMQTRHYGGRVDVRGCEYRGNTISGVGEIYGYSYWANCNFIAGEAQFCEQFPTLFGCVIQQAAALVVFPCCELELIQGNCFNGGHLAARQPRASLIVKSNLEFCNGGTGIAIDILEGGEVVSRALIWGASTPYDIGVRLTSLSKISALSSTSVIIPATIPVQMCGQNLTYADVPRSYDSADCAWVVGTDTTAIAGPAPFEATYHVNPNFTGRVKTGSASNPFISFAAAFAYAASVGVTSGIVFLPPNTTITENVTFPVAGNWEIACQAQWGYFSSIINGTVDLTCTTTARRALTNIQVNGTISGNAPNSTASRVRFVNCSTAVISLTASGSGSWRAAFVGSSAPAGLVGLGGSSSGAVGVAGDIQQSFWTFLSTVTSTTGGTQSACVYNTGFVTTGTAALNFYNCTFSAGTNFNASAGALTVLLDAVSAASLGSYTTTGAVTVTVLGGVTTVFGRSGPAVVAVNGDYTSSLVTNLSTVNGGAGTVTTALNTLNTAVAAVAAAIPGLVTNAVAGTVTVVGAAGTILRSTGTAAAWVLLTNTSVDNAAAIAGTKITPNFGAQDIITNGSLAFGGTGPGLVRIGDTGLAGDTGTDLTLRGQNSTGTGATVGGNVVVLGGTGAINGNVAFGAVPATWDGMGRGLYLSPVTSTPAAGAATGLFMWASSVSGQLMFSGAAGMAFGDGTQAMTFNTENVSTTSYRFQCAGVSRLIVQNLGIQLNTVDVLWGSGNNDTLVHVPQATVTSVAKLTIQAASSTASGAYKLGDLEILAGGTGANAGTVTGGNLLIAGGRGNGGAFPDPTDGNVAVGAMPASWQSMARGLFLRDSPAAATGAPTSGGFMYSATGAGTWRGSSNTLTTFGAA